MNSIHYRGEWYIKDISEEMEPHGWLTLNTYSDILEEDVEIASTVANDLDVEAMLATFNLIAHANDMFELLEECLEVFKQTKNKEMYNKTLELLRVSATEPSEGYEEWKDSLLSEEEMFGGFFED